MIWSQDGNLRDADGTLIATVEPRGSAGGPSNHFQIWKAPVLPLDVAVWGWAKTPEAARARVEELLADPLLWKKVRREV